MLASFRRGAFSSSAQDSSTTMSSRQDGLQSSRLEPTRLQNMRTILQHLFTGRSTVGRRERRGSVPGTPKTPRLPLGLQDLPATRLEIPFLNRSTTSSTSRSAAAFSPRNDSTPSPDTPASARPITPNSYAEMQRTMSMPQPALQSSSQPFVGVDPEERHLVETIGRRRHRRSRHGSRQGCMPNMKNRRIRSKAISCILSGSFLIIVLSTYLALALSTLNLSQEFHILFIMIILVTTILFCHSLMSLCILGLRPQSEEGGRPRASSLIGPGGYANPARPIRVALTRDEEAAGIESEATKFPPPAYGLWRESVRMDPNRVYWQRNESNNTTQHESTGHETEGAPGAPRPPSYLSDNGVDYIIEAAPRSIAPTVDVPLKQHPSERGRLPPRVETV